MTEREHDISEKISSFILDKDLFDKKDDLMNALRSIDEDKFVKKLRVRKRFVIDALEVTFEREVEKRDKTMHDISITPL